MWHVSNSPGAEEEIARCHRSGWVAEAKIQSGSADALLGTWHWSSLLFARQASSRDFRGLNCQSEARLLDSVTGSNNLMGWNEERKIVLSERHQLRISLSLDCYRHVNGKSETVLSCIRLGLQLFKELISNLWWAAKLIFPSREIASACHLVEELLKSKWTNHRSIFL